VGCPHVKILHGWHTDTSVVRGERETRKNDRDARETVMWPSIHAHVSGSYSHTQPLASPQHLTRRLCWRERHRSCRCSKRPDEVKGLDEDGDVFLVCRPRENVWGHVAMVAATTYQHAYTHVDTHACASGHLASLGTAPIPLLCTPHETPLHVRMHAPRVLHSNLFTARGRRRCAHDSSSPRLPTSSTTTQALNSTVGDTPSEPCVGGLPTQPSFSKASLCVLSCEKHRNRFQVLIH